MEKASLTIEVFDEINSELLHKIYKATKDMSDGDDVFLTIASYGGEIYSAIGIIDCLKRFNTHAVIVGFACSAAAILALACDDVSMSENSSLMLHSAWSEYAYEDDPGIVHGNEIQLKIIQKRCPEYSADMLKEDTWLSADECIKLHLADSIISDDLGFDYAATCKRYAAKLYKLYAKGGRTMAENVSVEEVIEQVKEDEEKKEEVSAEETEEKDHDIIEVIEKLSEKVSEMEARLKALEGTCEDSQPKAEESSDDEQDRINSIYNNLVRPQACAPIACASSKAIRRIPKGFEKYMD